MEMKELRLQDLNNQLKEVKSKLTKKYKESSLSDIEISIKMNELTTDFLLHSLINNAFENITDTKDRLEFYIDFLKNELHSD